VQTTSLYGPINICLKFHFHLHFMPRTNFSCWFPESVLSKAVYNTKRSRQCLCPTLAFSRSMFKTGSSRVGSQGQTVWLTWRNTVWRLNKQLGVQPAVNPLQDGQCNFMIWRSEWMNEWIQMLLNIVTTVSETSSVHQRRRRLANGIKTQDFVIRGAVRILRSLCHDACECVC